ncbi:DNA-processing protein DprA, partial [Streptomyces sp. NPDC002454]
MTADAERRARAALTRAIEPGDEVGGGWLRRYGAVEVARRLAGTGDPLPGVSARRWTGLRSRAERMSPEADLALARGAGIRFLCPGDPEWPAQLDDLGDARPIGLWVRGTPDLRLWALRSVAVVGARACTEYGAHVAAGLAADLAVRGWIVVSGGAYGIDGAAHRGTLGRGGATVAVLACGLDRTYPPGHRALLDRIAEQGLLVGELPPGDHPTARRFVLRNRVIAARRTGPGHRSGTPPGAPAPTP